MRANSKPVNKTVVTTVVTTTTQSMRSNSKPVNKTTVSTSKPTSRSNSKQVVKVTTTSSTSKPTSRSNSKQPVKVTTTSSTSKPTSRSNSKQASKPITSKPATKPAQVQQKKVEIKKVVFNPDDGDEIKNAFEFFDSNGNGKIDAREVRTAMQKIGYDENNPTVYEVVTELDNPRKKNTGGVSFDEFVETVNYKMPEKETLEDLRKVFNLFLDDPNSNTTSLESIKRVADELGENIEEIELNGMLNKASKAGARLTFDDFVALMSGNKF